MSSPLALLGKLTLYNLSLLSEECCDRILEALYENLFSAYMEQY